jgi:hypothetical protein
MDLIQQIGRNRIKIEGRRRFRGIEGIVEKGILLLENSV